jgi:uncharacterized protein (DUF488 family)
MIFPTIFTIGVFNSSEKEFFQKLIDNKIDTFIDIRRRRGVRGAEYAFVNSKRLQDKLEKLGIQYIYEINLAPTEEVRAIQNRSDEKNKIQKRKRTELDPAFKKAYTTKILSKFDLKDLMDRLKIAGAKNVVLFCVEESASACHRSLVTEKMKEKFPKIKIKNI